MSVIVINAAKVRVGGKKDLQKSYMSFSGMWVVTSRRISRRVVNAILSSWSSVLFAA